MTEKSCSKIVVDNNNLKNLLSFPDISCSKTMTVEYNDFDIKTNNLGSLYTEIKDIFILNIYGFNSNNPAPIVIDGGGHIGIFTLYVKKRYPDSKLFVFEPDESSFDCLVHNIVKNKLKSVECIKKGLFSKNSLMDFTSDGADGGTMFGNQKNSQIATCPLSGYINNEIDYLKLNIEGAELDVIQEIEPKLNLVKELCIEYHGFPEIGQKLHFILNILDRNGFRYLIHDFDQETNPATKPPFQIEQNSRFFLLIYAKRMQTQ